MSDISSEHRDIILESITEGVVTVDTNLIVTYFNRAAAEITGIDATSAVGRSCSDIFRCHEEACDCPLKQTMETGRPVVARQGFILDRKGGRIPVSISTAVLQDSKGKLVGGVETFRDLSLVEALRRELEQRYTFADIIGRSPSMRALFELMPDIAESDSTILIEGASGTGKELFARAIHDLSHRGNQRFVAINCGALPDSLLESELFGYKAGAFTDARRDKPGRFSAADRGTIFLDEIGDISPAMQSRLLRVLQERVIEPLGGLDSIKVDVRVIAATNRDLVELVREGKFREDLFFRINVFALKLPPLRDRREDIPILAEHFISRFNRRSGKNLIGVSEDALALLLNHDYPGNVRELENIIEHAFVLCRGWFIEPQHLPERLSGHSTSKNNPTAGAGTLANWERILIGEALRRHQGNRQAAARELGINPSTLFRKLRHSGGTGSS